MPNLSKSRTVSNQSLTSCGHPYATRRTKQKLPKRTWFHRKPVGTNSGKLLTRRLQISLIGKSSVPAIPLRTTKRGYSCKDPAAQNSLLHQHLDSVSSQASRIRQAAYSSVNVPESDADDVDGRMAELRAFRGRISPQGEGNC